MKKVFTLLALLTCFLGANAQGGKWEQVYSIDYSTHTGFPFFVMGYVPEFDNGYMTDFGAAYRYATQEELDGDGDAKWKDGETSVGTVKTEGGTEYQKVTGANPYWHQYFIADGIPTTIDGKYKVVAKVKASAACSINVNMGWGWGGGQQAGTSVAIPEGSDFQEVEWQYEGIGGSSCNLVAQPGTVTETIEWLSVTVYEWKKEGTRPQIWLQDIENGDAEKSWADLGLADVKFDDMDNNYKICAWGKERMVNTRVDENGNTAWDPFPATIEAEEGNPSNHVFVVHGKAATTDGDAAAWDNQFWIQSKHAWKSGTKLKIKFRYKASKDVKVATQTHKQKPSDYLIWHFIGDIDFTTEWKTYEGTVTMADDMADGWSIAFQLNQNDKDPIDFYFDDLSWEYLQLDDGFFVSGIDTNTNPKFEYNDLDNAIQFEEGESADGTPCLIAVVGEKGNSATYVDQLMISTTRGDDAAYKGATLKPAGKVKNDPDDWQEYTASSNARLDLPGLGVWKIYLDTEYKSIAFEMLEGTMYEEPDPIDIVTNTTENVVNGQERDWKPAKDDGNPQDGEEGVGTGQPWDNQFFILANREIKTGETVTLKFKYKSSVDAKTTTQLHGEPGAYIYWNAIGDVNFTTDWQDFEKTWEIPHGDNNAEISFKSIAFNMAEIKGACTYEIKDVQWYVQDATLEEGKTMENLINAEGDANFYVKEGAGTAPYVVSGISNVVNESKASNNAIYNLAGQRVSKEYKGIVIKNGAKYIAK
jgi:hypothetical protein